MGVANLPESEPLPHANAMDSCDSEPDNPQAPGALTSTTLAQSLGPD